MIIALAVLSILFFIQLLMPKARLKNVGLFGILALVLSAAAIFGWAFYQSWQQYDVWRNNEISRFLLPPYQSWDYFVFYARSRFFNPYLLSLAVGLLFLFAVKWLNKKYQERFFEPVEPYLFGLSVFIVGHPNWIFYFIFLLIAALAINSYWTYWSYRINKSDPIVIPAQAGIQQNRLISGSRIESGMTNKWPKSDKAYRISFYYLWLPAAIFTILISKWLTALSWWALLKL